jgi:hypothetical protein
VEAANNCNLVQQQLRLLSNAPCVKLLVVQVDSGMQCTLRRQHNMPFRKLMQIVGAIWGCTQCSQSTVPETCIHQWASLLSHQMMSWHRGLGMGMEGIAGNCKTLSHRV